MKISANLHRLILTTALVVAVSGASTLFAASASKYPAIIIWKSERMGYFNGHYFPVSIGHSGNPTPTGRYTVKKKVVDYWSKKYDRAMPYSVFFTDAHAIHSGDLTTPSKGCIRVDRAVAPWLFSWAQAGKTRVIIHP